MEQCGISSYYNGLTSDTQCVLPFLRTLLISHFAGSGLLRQECLLLGNRVLEMFAPAHISSSCCWLWGSVALRWGNDLYCQRCGEVSETQT